MSEKSTQESGQIERIPHDSWMKLLFSSKWVLRDLMACECLNMTDLKLNHDRLSLISTNFVTDNLHQRIGDLIWEVRLAEEHDESSSNLYIWLELQTSVDALMAARMQNYISELHRHLAREKKLKLPYPKLLPLVIYNGERRWNAALGYRELISVENEAWELEILQYYAPRNYLLMDVQRLRIEGKQRNLVLAWCVFEQAFAKGPASCLKAANYFLQGVLQTNDRELEKGAFEMLKKRLGSTFAENLGNLIKTGKDEEAKLRSLLTLEEQLIQKGREEGREEGMEKGREEGREEGIQREKRANLDRLMQWKHGSVISERMYEKLMRVEDPDQLDQVGYWIIKCDSLQDLEAKISTSLQ